MASNADMEAVIALIGSDYKENPAKTKEQKKREEAAKKAAATRKRNAKAAAKNNPKKTKQGRKAKYWLKVKQGGHDLKADIENIVGIGAGAVGSQIVLGLLNENVIKPMDWEDPENVKKYLDYGEPAIKLALGRAVAELVKNSKQDMKKQGTMFYYGAAANALMDLVSPMLDGKVAGFRAIPTTAAPVEVTPIGPGDETQQGDYSEDLDLNYDFGDYEYDIDVGAYWEREGFEAYTEPDLF